MTTHKRNNLHHESGGKFAHTIANIGHEIGKTASETIFISAPLSFLISKLRNALFT